MMLSPAGPSHRSASSPRAVASHSDTTCSSSPEVIRNSTRIDLPAPTVTRCVRWKSCFTSSSLRRSCRDGHRRRRHRRASAGTSSGSSMRAYASTGRSSRASRRMISASRTAARWTRSSRTSGSITARSARTSSTTSGAIVLEPGLGRQPRDRPVARLHELPISSHSRCPQSVVTALRRAAWRAAGPRWHFLDRARATSCSSRWPWRDRPRRRTPRPGCPRHWQIADNGEY